MTKHVKNDRRRFLLGAGALLSGGALAGTALAEAAKKAGSASGSADGATKAGAAPAAGGNLPLVAENSSLAQTLKYVHDASKAPAAIKVAKGGVNGANQYCDNCMFYTKSGTNGGKEAGKCQLFAQGHVMAKGWCTSWTKKP